MRELCRSQPGWDCRALAAAGAEVWRLEGTPAGEKRPRRAGAGAGRSLVLPPGRAAAGTVRRAAPAAAGRGRCCFWAAARRTAWSGSAANRFRGSSWPCRNRRRGRCPHPSAPAWAACRAGIGHGARVVTAVLWGEAFFHTLEQLPASEQGTYCALKTGELFFLLQVGKAALLRPQGERYYDHYQLQAVQGVRDYMRAHLDEHLTIPELAGRFHISATMLKACFRQVYGVPVHQYLLEQRMVQAAELLASHAPQRVGRGCRSRVPAGPGSSVRRSGRGTAFPRRSTGRRRGNAPPVRRNFRSRKQKTPRSAESP